MLQSPAVTTSQMWLATVLAAVIDIGIASLLWKRASRERFARLSWWFACVAGIQWACIYGVAALAAWDSCYRYVMPPWVRWAAWIYGLGHVLLALVFWWIVMHVRTRPVIALAILGGLHSLPGHLNGIYARHLLEACPLVRGISPGSALIFGAFEFAFYWMMALTLSMALQRIATGRGGMVQPPHSAARP